MKPTSEDSYNQSVMASLNKYSVIDSNEKLSRKMINQSSRGSPEFAEVEIPSIKTKLNGRRGSVPQAISAYAKSILSEPSSGALQGSSTLAMVTEVPNLPLRSVYYHDKPRFGQDNS